MNALLLTADQILAVPVNEPERIFSRKNVAEESRDLIKSWHPDIRHEALAGQVTAHIVLLRRAAEKKLAAGVWEEAGILELTGTDKMVRRIPYKMHRSFELGALYYGPNKATFVIDTEWADLVYSARSRIFKLTFRDPEMKAQMEKFLPSIFRSFESVSAQQVIIMPKTEDIVLLADLLKAVGTVPKEHVAWIINSLYNTACYLEWAGLTHNGIDATTIFVSPEKHSTHLLSGWWYSAQAGHHMNALASFAHANTPPDMLKSKVADSRLDLALIKAVGREMLGDRTGMTLSSNSAIPAPMAQFLRSPSSGSAQHDYMVWSTEVIPACFGQRRFVQWDISPAVIYTA